MKELKKQLKKGKPSGTDKHDHKKEQKRLENKRKHLKVLVRYIDKDYETVKNRFVPYNNPQYTVLTHLQPLPHAGKRVDHV